VRLRLLRKLPPPRDRTRLLATEAGLIHFRRIDFPNNPFNLFYEIRA
jgi:hypothetical protein